MRTECCSSQSYMKMLVSRESRWWQSLNTWTDSTAQTLLREFILLYSSEIQQIPALKTLTTKYRVMLSMKTACGCLLAIMSGCDLHRLMQSAGVWMFNPWASTLTGSPYYTMDHGEEQIASSPSQSSNPATHTALNNTTSQHRGLGIFTCSFHAFSRSTLTEVWMEDEWKED